MLDLTSTIKSIDLSIAQEFIVTLTGSSDTPVTFQTFDDGDRKLPALCQQWTGSLALAQSKLEQLSSGGAGLFVTVQQTNGKGRKADNVTSVRALFVDFDGHLPLGQQWHLQPSMIVRSSGNKGHAYWVLSEPIEPNKEQFRKLQQGLIAHYRSFGSDPSCCDLARVLRIPGSYHLKGEPTLSTLIFNSSSRYTVDKVMKGIADCVEPKAKYKPEGTNTATSKDKTAHSKPLWGNAAFDRMLKASAATLAGWTENRNNQLNIEAGTMAGKSGGDPDRLVAIRSALTAAAITCGLKPEEILQTLESGIKFGLENPLVPYSCELIEMGSLAAGKLLADEVLSNHKFDTLANQWMQYDGKGKWNPVGDARIFKLVQDYLSDKVKIASPVFLDHCIRFAKSHVQVDGWSEMSSLQYLPFTNGVLDIKANHFQGHSPDFGFTWQLPRDYLPTLGDWSQIDRFLDTLANNDSELKMLAIAFCNAVLKGRSDLQKFLYLFGGGGNGKGAFINLLKMLVGLENVHSTTMGELNGNRFESANLKGMRLLVMSDEDKRSGGVGVFKSAVGGDSIRCERKGKDASHFIYTGMVVVAANSPTFAGTSDGGIKRRKVDYPCKSFIKEMDRADMNPLFDADLTAFTTYLLSLDDAWVTETIRKASSINAVKELSRELAIREDSVAAFADAMGITAAPVGEVRNAYAGYKRFCELNGLKPKSSVNFIPSFIECCKDEGFEVKNKRDNKGKYLLGLAIVVPEMYI